MVCWKKRSMHTQILEKAFSNNHLSNFSSRIWRILLCPRQIPGKKRNLFKVFLSVWGVWTIGKHPSRPPPFPENSPPFSSVVEETTVKLSIRECFFPGKSILHLNFFLHNFFWKKWLTAESIFGKKKHCGLRHFKCFFWESVGHSGQGATDFRE